KIHDTVDRVERFLSRAQTQRMAAVWGCAVLVDARDGAGMGRVHARAIRTGALVAAPLVQGACAARCGRDVFHHRQGALGVARREPDYDRGCCRRQPWLELRPLSYALLKLTHIAAVIVSFSLFVMRGLWMMYAPQKLQ